MSTESIEPTQHGQDCQPSEIEAMREAMRSAEASLHSLSCIITDITLKVNHQVLGNCETLKFMEAKIVGEDITVESLELKSEQEFKQVKMKVLQSQQIEGLIINPVKSLLGRINGLHKIISQVREKLK